MESVADFGGLRSQVRRKVEQERPLLRNGRNLMDQDIWRRPAASPAVAFDHPQYAVGLQRLKMRQCVACCLQFP